MDEGLPSSYLLLAKDTPAFGADGGIVGTVKEVLCEPSRDIFDGLVLDTPAGDRFVSADQVTAIHERGVDVSMPASPAPGLPLPAAHRHVKYDVAADERPWSEVLHWLSSHLAHLLHPADGRLEAARERLKEREKALRMARDNPRLALEAGVGRPRSARCLRRRCRRCQPCSGRGHRRPARVRRSAGRARGQRPRAECSLRLG